MNRSSGVPIHVCSGCGTKTDRGWRQYDGSLHCPECHGEDHLILSAQQVVTDLKRLVDDARFVRKAAAYSGRKGLPHADV